MTQDSTKRYGLPFWERLAEAEKLGLKRTLKLREGLDLSSNDYLGFSQDPVLRERVQARLTTVPLGASGSRLLRGQLDLFEKVESRLAEFCGQESATLFHSGYQANVGLLSAILREGDVVYSDSHNHASIIDGIRLGRGRKEVYPHKDVDALRELLLNSTSKGLPKGLKVIVTESLFSMDGDIAPLQRLAKVAQEFSALLIVDEAHATGLWGNFEGNRGGGVVQSLGLSKEVFATVHTGGKSLGVGGAWVAGNPVLKEILVNFSRPFIFSTGIVPAVAVLLDESVAYWKEVGISRAKEVHQCSEYLRTRLNVASDCEGPIVPLILGSNERALAVSEKLQSLGYDVRAIRPPTVPEGTARLRITTNRSVTRVQLERFAADLAGVL